MVALGYKLFIGIITTLIILIFLKYQYYAHIDVNLDILGFSLASVEVNRPKIRFIRKYQNEVYVGKGFDAEWDHYLDQFGLLNVKPTNRRKILNTTPVIITALSSNHFYEAQTLLKSISKLYNDTKMLYVYDLGLTENEKQEISTVYNNTVIEIRKFPFNIYPYYIRYLFEYRWKPLLIAQALKEFQAIWYMDASVQIQKPLNNIYDDFKLCKNRSVNCSSYPWVLGISTAHSIHSATNPKMYKYFPIPNGLAKNITMYEAGYQLIYGLKEVKENVLRYWVLCALQKDCMAPKGSHLSCKFKLDRHNRYVNCHRFDQSAINILLSWANNFRSEKYTSPIADSVILKGK